MNYTSEDDHSDILRHYGVLGMKWGVRRNRASKAFDKATKKAKRLDARAKSFREVTEAHRGVSKVYNKQARELRKQRAANDVFKPSKAKIAIAERRARKADARLKRADDRALRSEGKSEKWRNKMGDAFRYTKVSQIDPMVRNYGKDYINMLFDDTRKRKK